MASPGIPTEGTRGGSGPTLHPRRGAVAQSTGAEAPGAVLGQGLPGKAGLVCFREGGCCLGSRHQSDVTPAVRSSRGRRRSNEVL
jgi:hypothetical protein